MKIGKIRYIAAMGLAAALTASAAGCSAGGAKSGADSAALVEETPAAAAFSADSAYAYVKRQVDFGPRVPNTAAHRAAGDWLSAQLRQCGAEVTEQKMQLKAFDGTMLDARNILGRFNPEASERILLLAHWDCRPWADEDEDESKRSMPVDGANDGASGVGVLLEIARQLAVEAPKKGVDILFVDAEDWGESSNEDSWALGARYFVENSPIKGYSPKEAILLDMVGGENARFHREFFSEQAAGDLNARIWATAASLGYADSFIDRPGAPSPTTTCSSSRPVFRRSISSNTTPPAMASIRAGTRPTTRWKVSRPRPSAVWAPP